ncbi:MAG: tRNA pseudouridine(38-40) synthase TruA, partial [Candidatus Polarisedimenticolia bacterium]
DAGRPLRNIRLLIEYEGTRYAGWQFQPAQRTVAGDLLEAIHRTLRDRPRLFGAGRTDQGVHAEGQVANFQTRARETPDAVADALNRELPADINVIQASEAPLSFHARHDAVARRYRYQIASRRSAFFKRLIWWVRHPLNLAAMEEGARALSGRHDFTSFADRSGPIAEPRVRVFSAAFRRGEFLTSFTIEADHFLPRMVRRVVGVLVEIGAGRLPPESVTRFLREIVEDPAQWTAPPSGLFLEKVLYPGDPVARGAGAVPSGSTGGPSTVAPSALAAPEGARYTRRPRRNRS